MNFFNMNTDYLYSVITNENNTIMKALPDEQYNKIIGYIIDQFNLAQIALLSEDLSTYKNRKQTYFFSSSEDLTECSTFSDEQNSNFLEAVKPLLENTRRIFAGPKAVTFLIKSQGYLKYKEDKYITSNIENIGTFCDIPLYKCTSINGIADNEVCFENLNEVKSMLIEFN